MPLNNGGVAWVELTSLDLYGDKMGSHGRYRIGCSVRSGAKSGKSHEGGSTRKDLTSTQQK